jgi:acetyltransferase-like isoleucine patch superfamily enzyme
LSSFLGIAIFDMDLTSFRRRLATSDHWAPRMLRELHHSLSDLAVPAPPALVRPVLNAFVATRSAYFEAVRIFWCEPMLKAYCKSYGKGVHTSAHLPWIQGRGALVLGDKVTFSGKVSITFAARYVDEPLLEIGSQSGLSSGCRIVVAKSVKIGNFVRIGQDVSIRDSNGHVSDPEGRKRGDPPADDEVRPVTIEDNVWIGAGVTIGPGITIGEGSIVSAKSVVLSNIPPYSIASGFPARKIGSLTRAAAAENTSPVDENR